MIKPLRTSPEQWAALVAVIDTGGFAAAAESLSRSLSSVSYQVSRLQRAIGCPLLETHGRRAVLTAGGRALLDRARSLLDQWRALELYADSLGRGFEPVLKLVVDAAFPRGPLLDALLALKVACPQTRIDLSDAVLSGAEQAIVQGAANGSADVVVTSRVPPGFLGDYLYVTTFTACASPAHPLHALGSRITVHDLERHQQIVLRDSGTSAPRDDGFLGARLRWTVGSFDASLALVESGLAYAWLPEQLIAASLAAGRLVRLRLAAGGSRKVPLYVVLVRPAAAGPAAHAAVELLHRHALEDRRTIAVESQWGPAGR